MKSMIDANIEDRNFDIAIWTCGYEQRARYICENQVVIAKSNLVFDYQSLDILDFNKNKSYFESIDNVSFYTNELDLLNQIGPKLEALDEESESLKLFLDVSSCSRSVAAKILENLKLIASARAKNLLITIGYALSEFSTPPDSELPCHISEPVIGELSGWSSDLSKPPFAIVGIGFEPGRALGAIDYLEIPEVRIFFPKGPDARFDGAVAAANSFLIEEETDGNVLPYSILSPNILYEKMVSLVTGIFSQYRPVVIPLGPKIFAAVAIVLALNLAPNICVWRTSSGPSGNPQNIKPQGPISIFRFEW